MGKTKPVPVLMFERANATPIRGDDDTVTIDHGYRQLPFDFPAYVQLHRLMDESHENENDKSHRVVRGLKGHVMTVELFTHGVDVIIRQTQAGVKVYAKDSEGTTLLGEWEKSE